MKKIWQKLFENVIRWSFYLFVFLLPWQTKLIIKSSGSNFNEISFYASHILLLIALLFFVVYRAFIRERDERAQLIWYCLAGFSFFVFLSFFFAPDKALAFYKYIIIMLGFGLFYLLHEGFKRQAYTEAVLEKSKVIFVFLSSIFLHVSLGIYQFLNQKAFAFKYLGLAAHYTEDLGVSVIETLSGRWLRAYGGFDHPNIFGGVLAISIILASYLLSKKKLIRTRKETTESIFLFVFYFFALLALIFSFSRSAWLALGFGFLSLFITFLLRKEKWALGRLTALFFFSAILSGVIYFSYQELFVTRIQAEGRLEQISVSERQLQIAEAGGILKEKWLFGVGIGNYNSFLLNQDLQNKGFKKADWAYQPVHNSFLLLWAESGLLALFFFLAFFVALWRRPSREVFSWSLLLPLILLMFFDHWLLSLPFGIIFLFFIFGLI
ncbi:O-antigen ligase family protein [Patescibacteria group bacterium]|nr:O-antigen ligase family protein [Patescibacteria group bacterium]